METGLITLNGRVSQLGTRGHPDLPPLLMRQRTCLLTFPSGVNAFINTVRDTAGCRIVSYRCK